MVLGSTNKVALLNRETLWFAEAYLWIYGPVQTAFSMAPTNVQEWPCAGLVCISKRPADEKVEGKVSRVRLSDREITRL